MNQSFPTPPIKPFDRLQVTDGLLMNAERWRQAHEYHRQRQNIHYQSLNQPGIVCGLGVRLITAPTEMASQYRDERWIQIQPGIAIDLSGNPIVVPQAENYRIASENLTLEPLTVYLVISYVDPDKLRLKEQREIVQETFRLDEKTHSPSGLEVEICRIILQPNVDPKKIASLRIKNPQDVFFPEYNSLDLRYRNQAGTRPQAVVRAAQLIYSYETDPHNLLNLSYLLDAIAPLYPNLQGSDEVGLVNKELKNEEGAVTDYDLVYLSGQQGLTLNEAEFEAIKSYLAAGGVLLVESPTDGSILVESITALAQQLGTPLENLDGLSRNHPLRSQPFLFAALPSANARPIKILAGGGIVLIIGDLSSAWGLDEQLSLSRTTIRNAQELGINILYFAWRRRQMTQALKDNSPPIPEKAIASQSVFDKLLE